MINFSDVRVRMDKIVSLFVNDIASIRTGRATPGLIENVVVTVYGGQKMKLIELGSIGVPDVRSLTFQPWDQTLIREIANGIAAANIGMTPAIDGQIIKLNATLDQVAKKKYKYAKIHALAFSDSLYAVESQGFLINIDENFDKDVIYDFSFDNEERMIAIGNKIYFGSDYITLP